MDGHAYVAIKDGVCVAIFGDTPNVATAETARKMILDGCYLDRVPIAIARKALFQSWPMDGL